MPSRSERFADFINGCRELSKSGLNFEKPNFEEIEQRYLRGSKRTDTGYSFDDGSQIFVRRSDGRYLP